MATKDVKEFNGWFNRSYARLKERLSIYGKIDEDAFHDAYLAVRKQIMFASGGIDESRYDSPGDEYFARLGETDCAEETEEREEMLTGCDRLVRDIQKFLRRHFSYEDYRIFMLRFYETGSSFRTIARHMGEKTSVVTRRAQAMMESVRANRKFIARRRLIMAGEAA